MSKVRPHCTQAVLSYVSQRLKQAKSKPLVIGLSGPQGSGKSTVVKAVAEELRQDFGLNVVEFSLDDVYLTHNDQKKVASAGNSLLQHRGLPGTHDVPLCIDTLASLNRQQATQIPQYDKSAFAGEGDRSSDTVAVKPNYDVVLLEGWCVGFLPLSDLEVEQRWNQSTGPLKRHSLQSVKQVNEYLKGYVDIWTMFDALVHLDALDLNYVYEWRLQQEHAMISAKGSGMSDDQVRAFVDGYMPAYELYNEGLRHYTGNKLWLKLAKDRRPINEHKM